MASGLMSITTVGRGSITHHGVGHPTIMVAGFGIRAWAGVGGLVLAVITRTGVRLWWVSLALVEALELDLQDWAG